MVAARWWLLGGGCSVVAARWWLLGGGCSGWLLSGGCGRRRGRHARRAPRGRGHPPCGRQQPDAGLFLPRLDRAGRIEIAGNVAVTTISLPQFATVRDAVRITDNASLELVDMPNLAAIDHDLVLTGDPKLALVEAAQLRTAATVQIDAPLLPSEVADRLRSIAAAL